MAFFVFVKVGGVGKGGFRVMLKDFEIKRGFFFCRASRASQKTSNRGKNISDTHGYASCAIFLFLSHFDVICDLLLNRRTAT